MRPGRFPRTHCTDNVADIHLPTGAGPMFASQLCLRLGSTSILRHHERSVLPKPAGWAAADSRRGGQPAPGEHAAWEGTGKACGQSRKGGGGLEQSAIDEFLLSWGLEVLPGKVH